MAAKALGVQWTSFEARVDLVLYGPHKPERSGLAIAKFLIIRYLPERSARFYTEENFGRRVYTEPDIHCYASSLSFLEK